MRRGAAFHAQRDARRSIAAAASAGLTVPEVAAFTRAVPVLAKPILLRLGVELHRALREVFALPGLDRRRTMGATRDARQRQSGDQPEPEPHGDQPHATFYHGRARGRARAVRNYSRESAAT